MKPERMARLVARWVRLHTSGLPAPVARRRIEGIDADLHDQIAHERSHGAGERRYRDFARGYGSDLRDSALARELASLRLLAPTVNMILNGARDPACAAEAKARIRYWLGDPTAPAWTPF
jgi:hypothetical protein